MLPHKIKPSLQKYLISEVPIMGFWIFMLIFDLLVPLMMIGIGRIFMKRPPKEINYLLGYRTSMSMKNNDTWKFANTYFGRLWYIWGLVLLPLAAAVMIAVIGKPRDTVAVTGLVLCFVQMALMIAVIIPTEMALRKKFDKDGNPR